MLRWKEATARQDAVDAAIEVLETRLKSESVETMVPAVLDCNCRVLGRRPPASRSPPDSRHSRSNNLQVIGTGTDDCARSGVPRARQ